MISLTVWLLLSVGSEAYAGSPTMVVYKFSDEKECKRISSVINKQGGNTICVQTNLQP